MKDARDVALDVIRTVYSMDANDMTDEERVSSAAIIEADRAEAYQRGRREALEEAFRAVCLKCYWESKGMPGAKKHAHTSACNQLLRALAGVDREAVTREALPSEGGSK